MMSWLYNGLVSAGVVLAFVAVVRAAPQRGSPLFNPVVVTALAIAVTLAVTGTSVERFEVLTAPLRWALGPAIVALGALVHLNRAALRARGPALLVAVAVGATTGVASALLLARGLGLGDELAAATLTRTISTPFAIVVHTRTGGPVSLAAAFAVLTGVIGAILLPPLLKSLRLDSPATLGTAVGVAAHIVGTDAIRRRDATAGAFAGVATVATGVAVAIVVPPLWRWLLG